MVVASLLQEFYLKGISISSGIVIGKPFFVLSKDCAENVPEYFIEPDKIDLEIERYRAAVKKTRDHIFDLKRRHEENGLQDSASILEAHAQILEDSAVKDSMESRIREEKKNAEYIVFTTFKQLEEKFNNIGENYFEERFKDIKDIISHVMNNLRGCSSLELSNVPENTILFTEEVLTTDVANIKGSSVEGFVTHVGGRTSHAAILSRSKSIPYISGIDVKEFYNQDINLVILDGNDGAVILNPSEETIAKYREMKGSEGTDARLASLPTETVDGTKIELLANIDDVNDIEKAKSFGCDGVGLFRTEYSFLSYDEYPSEDEQFELYSEVVEAMEGKPVTFRTFDVGGDKPVKYLNIRKEENPALGCRGIRLMLKEEEKFKAQLKAILRASIFGNVRIMFPMISCVEEFLDASNLLSEAKLEVLEDGETFSENIAVGVLIEVPSAAMFVHEFFEHCDFISLGTNDLIQYLTAVDRNNLELSNDLLPEYNPAVVSLILEVILECKEGGMPLSICGELAADGEMLLDLIAYGVRELSVSPANLPFVKKIILESEVFEE